MDILEKIYTNMENTIKQNGRWHTLSILLSVVLLAISLDIVSAKDELSISGVTISMPKIYFISTLIFAVLATLLAGVATGLHGDHLRNVLRKYRMHISNEINLSSEEWENCVEPKALLSLLTEKHVIGDHTWKNLPGFIVLLILVFTAVILPFTAVGFGLIKVYEVNGVTWWGILFSLLTLVAMFYTWRGLRNE